MKPCGGPPTSPLCPSTTGAQDPGYAGQVHPLDSPLGPEGHLLHREMVPALQHGNQSLFGCLPFPAIKLLRLLNTTF